MTCDRGMHAGSALACRDDEEEDEEEEEEEEEQRDGRRAESCEWSSWGVDARTNGTCWVAVDAVVDAS